MDYPDANGETFTASRCVTLYPSAIQLGLKTDGWLMRDNDLRLQFVTLDLNGKPVSGKSVKVAIYSARGHHGAAPSHRRLLCLRQSGESNAGRCRLLRRQRTRSDVADCAIDPGVSGQVTVVATTTDDQGREAHAVRSVWLVGENDWWFGGDNGDRMDVIPEQNSYKSGDTARFQVRMPFRSATALVTVEREGVLSSFVTTLSGTNPVVEVKLDAAYAPNRLCLGDGRARTRWRLATVARGSRPPLAHPLDFAGGRLSDSTRRPCQAELPYRRGRRYRSAGRATALRSMREGRPREIRRARHRAGFARRARPFRQNRRGRPMSPSLRSMKRCST